MPVIKKGLTQHVLALRRRRFCVETLARANANDIDAERTPRLFPRTKVGYLFTELLNEANC